MLNVNFNLRKKASKKPEIIYLVLRWDGNYYRYTTKFSVLPKNWDTQKQRIRAVITEPQKDTVNKYLGNMETAVRRLYLEAVTNQIHPTKEYFKLVLDKWTGRKVEEKPNFWKFVNSYIENSNRRLDIKTGRTISTRTIQEYYTTTKALEAFEIENRQIIDFDNISVNTLTDFRDYLTTIKGFAVNNVAKHIDNLRQFLRAATAQKIAFDTDTIDNKKFTNAREAAYNIYLSEKELSIISALALAENPRLDRARDLFLIGCYTGLRVSDYNNIKPHNIKGEFIDIYQTKTSGRVVIPIHKTVKKILVKYDGHTPPKLSDQKLNEYIKEVCKLAGITDHTEKQQTKAGAKVISVLEKWQMVSSHTARRSFATNMVKQGVPMQTIMKITGHKKEATFLKYVKLSAGEHAEIMQKHWRKNKSH